MKRKVCVKKIAISKEAFGPLLNVFYGRMGEIEAKGRTAAEL